MTKVAHATKVESYPSPCMVLIMLGSRHSPTPRMDEISITTRCGLYEINTNPTNAISHANQSRVCSSCKGLKWDWLCKYRLMMGDERTVIEAKGSSIQPRPALRREIWFSRPTEFEKDTQAPCCIYFRSPDWAWYQGKIKFSLSSCLILRYFRTLRCYLCVSQ
jgi:hypothetical protein